MHDLMIPVKILWDFEFENELERDCIREEVTPFVFDTVMRFKDAGSTPENAANLLNRWLDQYEILSLQSGEDGL